jgi:hypothetical protein
MNTKGEFMYIYRHWTDETLQKIAEDKGIGSGGRCYPAEIAAAKQILANRESASK